MKRFFLTILAFLVMAGVCFGAGDTWLWTLDSPLNGHDGKVVARIIVTTYLANSDDNTLVNLTLYDSYHTDGTNEGNHKSIFGWYLRRVDIIPGATGPLDDSDLYIYSPTASTFDVLNGSGVNQVDNATTRWIHPSDGVSSIKRLITGPLVLNISGNTTNSATGTVTLIIEPTP
uniref:Uncharacterized protein n=1 Tax=viral metagenome TaxID=1070528 RepID=A0A6M3IST5_9ZZZZ